MNQKKKSGTKSLNRAGRPPPWGAYLFLNKPSDTPVAGRTISQAAMCFVFKVPAGRWTNH